MARPAVLMWDAAYDYVRLTWSTEENADEVYEVYRKVAISIVAGATGGEVLQEPWGWLGYTGHKYGLVQMGRGRQGLILQASQWAAQAVREHNPPHTGVPRCDVQVTAWYDVDPGEMPRAYADKSAAMAASQGARGWQVRHIDGYGRGDTAYLGSRVSGVFARIYDKGRESGQATEYENALRYEVEFKDGRAAGAWSAEARNAPGRDYLAALVQGTLRARGVYVTLPAAAVARYALPAPSVESSTERRLAWLSTQVRASVDKLIADGVSSAHIRAALGLD